VEDTFTLGSLGSADLVLSGEGNLMNFENSDNVTHLLVANFFGSKGQDLDADDDGVLDEPVPWLHTVDSVALVENLNEPPTDTEWWYGDTVVGPDGEYVPGQVYRCVPDGEWWIGEFGPDETDTPGEANPSCNPDSDGDGFTDDVDNCPFIYNPDQLDCDEDGMGDVCAIADAYSQDCNGNGIPDECDLVDNPDWDADGDGLIDECYVEPPTDVVINEIRIDQIGSDNDEYFELFGPSGTSLDGVKYIVIGDGEPGDSGVIEAVIALDGLDIPGDGLFLTVEDTYTLGSVFDADYILSGEANLMNFENSDNVTHMLVANFFGGRGQDLDADDDGEFDAPGPWLDTLDMVALVESLDEPPTDTEWWYGQTVVGPDGEFAPGHVYRCVPEGDWLVGPFDVDDAEAADTPGAVNPDCPEPECPADITGDGVVDVLDILEVLAQWGGSGSADITGNGVVDVLDLLEVLAAWGPC